jgi:hypothetical protein
MRTSIRLTLVACASLAALVFANAAWSAYEPTLLIAGSRQTLNSPAEILIGVAQGSRDDDPTAKIDISVPEGYSERLGAAPGTVIGDVVANVILRGAGNAEVEVTGQVRADNPASHTTNQCAPGLHTAVWVLEVTLAGTPVRVPIYVDDVTTLPGVSARIQLCLAGPIGTPSGSQLLSAIFTVRDVFTNPSRRAAHVWSALFTPYNPGSPLPNAAGTVEARAVVPLPVTITMTTRRKGRVVTISGRVNLPGNAIPAQVELWSGPSARRLRRVTRLRVRSNGAFTARRRVGRRTRIQFYQARLDTPFAGAEAFGYCQNPPPRVPRGCVSATFSALDVRGPARRVRFPRRR